MKRDRLMDAIADAARAEIADSPPPELARPLDPAEIEALTAKLPSPVPTSQTEDAGAAVASLDARRRGRARRYGRTVAIAAPLAAAAIALLVLHSPGSSGGSQVLPTYDLSVEGSDGVQRGADNASANAPNAIVRRSVTGRLTLLVRPHDPTSTVANVRVLLDSGDKGGDTLRDLPADVQRSAEGAFRVVVDSAALASVPQGPARVVLLIADDGHMPKDVAGARAAVIGLIAGVQVKTVRLEVTR